MNKEKFLITTPIYYWNGDPHIWHFYSSTIADIINRYKKVSLYNTKFTTWIDENSQKSVLKAAELWIELYTYLDTMAEKHKSVWDHFKLNYNDFIRTTEDRHHKLVREVLQTCFDRGDIYEWVYEWMYCVWCEAFKKDDDLIEKDWLKVCSDHLKVPDKIKEKNYFFRLSKYQTWLEEFFIENPWFVNPDFRYNEVKAFTNRWLEDFSISRETNTFGIPLPFDEKQVAYVWFDALFNYYTCCKYSRWDDKDNTCFIDEIDFWLNNPNKIHVVGKDIIRFHAIFWPCMLASYFWLWELKSDWKIHYKKSDSMFLPTTILATGYFTVDWQKMSKSLWNVIEPVSFSSTYSKDLLVLYIIWNFFIGQDGDFSKEQAVFTYNAKLANNLWNLLNRVVVLSLKIWWKLEWEVKNDFSNIISKFDNYDLKWVLDESFAFLDNLNNYTTQKEPWKMLKDETKILETKEVLYTIAEWLRQIWIILYPFFPEKMIELFNSLWFKDYQIKLENDWIKKLLSEKEVFEITEKWNILFQKFE